MYDTGDVNGALRPPRLRYIMNSAMGCIRDHDLRQPPGESEPQPVGASSVFYQHATATIVTVAGGRIQYGDEVEIAAWPGRWFELPLDGRTLYWSGIEIKTADKRWSGHSVVAALTSTGGSHWFAAAPFRRAYKHADRTAAIHRILAQGLPLRAMRSDPFETDRGWWTARLDDPRRLPWEDGDCLGGGYLRTARPLPDARAFWHFAICSPEALEAAEAIAPGLHAGSAGHVAKTGYQPGAASTVSPLAAAVWRALAGRARDEAVTFQDRLQSFLEGE